MVFSAVERRDRLRELVDELHGLAGIVAKEGHWPANRIPTGAHVGSYVERLFAHLTRADDRNSQAELRLLQSYNRDQFTWTEEDEWVMETTAAHPDFSFVVPEFFQVACVHDRTEGTSVATEMLGIILKICDVIIEVDFGVDVREHLLRSEIQSVLLADVRHEKDSQ